MKFTGAACPDGFEIEKDNQKYWDPDQSGKGSSSFPLLKSWEDVILLKKARLYVAELKLRFYRLERMYPSRRESCRLSTDWLNAVEENKRENLYRKEVSKYWTDIRNLSINFSKEMYFEMLPTDDMALLTGPTFKDKKELTVVLQHQEMYQNVLSYLLPIRQHLEKKYGKHINVFSEFDLKRICDVREDLLSIVLEAAQSGDFLNENFNSTRADVDAFIADAMKESNRPNDEIVAENIRKHEWTSGYIDQSGNFYGCSNLNHINFAEDLCVKFKFKKSTDSEDGDGQKILDKNGWVKVSMNRFFWDHSYKVNESQKVAIHDYMCGKDMMKALFNTCLSGEEKLFRDFFY